MKKINRSCIVPFAIMIFFWLVAEAAAHAVVVWAYAEKGTVYVEAFFPNGRPVQQAEVIVIDQQEKILLKGTTNDQGKFNYPLKVQAPQTIVVRSGESHTGDYELDEVDLGLISKDEKMRAINVK